MAYSVGSYRGLGYSALQTYTISEEHPTIEDKIHKDRVQELNIRLKELNASIMEGQPQSILKAYGALISRLGDDLDTLTPEESIEYLQKSTNLLEMRLLDADYQKVILPYLLIYTKKYLKMTFDARYDLALLIQIKNIFEPYFGGENFLIWKEMGTDSIVKRGWKFDCTSYQLSDYVTHWTILIHIFSQPDIDLRPLATSFKKLTKEVAFDFLDLLYESEIGYSLFNEVMREKLVGKLIDTEVLIIAQYIKLSGFKLAHVSKLLIEAENKCEINFEGWNFIILSLFQKIEKEEKFLLLDVWYFATLFNDIKKEIGLDEEFDRLFLAFFEQKIQVKLKDKTSFNCLGFGKSDVLNLVNDFRNIVPIGENLTTDIQRDNFVAVLIGVITIHLPALKCERAFELLESLAPLIKKKKRSLQVDSLLLRLVVDLLSQGGVENSKGQMILIERLIALFLFNNADMYSLLKDWNYLYEDFMMLCRDEFFLFDVMSPILGMSQRELALYLYVQPPEETKIERKIVFNIHKTLQRVVYKTEQKGGPSLLELNLINRFALGSNKSIPDQIKFFKYLVCLFDLPSDLKKLILAKILKTAMPYESLKKDTGESRNGIQLPKKVTVNTIQVNYLDCSAIFEFLNAVKNDFDPEEMGIEIVHLIQCLLLTPLSLQKTSFISELDKEIGLKKESALKNDGLMMKSLEEYRQFTLSVIQHFKLDFNKIIPKVCLNWISACDGLYIALRKKAYYLYDQKGDMKVRDFSRMSDEERAYFFVLKTAIHKMVVDCHTGISLGTLLDVEEANRCIKSLNRPFFLKFLPGESIMVFKGERLKLRKIKK